MQYWQLIDYCFYKDICPSPIAAVNTAPIILLSNFVYTVNRPGLFQLTQSLVDFFRYVRGYLDNVLKVFLTFFWSTEPSCSIQQLELYKSLQHAHTHKHTQTHTQTHTHTTGNILQDHDSMFTVAYIDVQADARPLCVSFPVDGFQYIYLARMHGNDTGRSACSNIDSVKHPVALQSTLPWCGMCLGFCCCQQ